MSPSWWQRLPAVQRARAGAQAVALAHALVEQGVDDVAAVARLREVGGGQRALEDATWLTAQQADLGYPHGRACRLLAAAAGQPAAVPTDAETAVEARQQQLWDQPYNVSFQELAEQVPELRELEQRVRSDLGGFLEGLTFRNTGRIGGPPPRAEQRDGQVLILVALQKAVRRLVGPSSGLPEPVLSSTAAERAAWHYLREATGIDPLSWRTR